MSLSISPASRSAASTVLKSRKSSPCKNLEELSPQKLIFRDFTSEKFADFIHKETSEEFAFMSKLRRPGKNRAIQKSQAFFKKTENKLNLWKLTCPAKEHRNREIAAERITNFLHTPSSTELDLSGLDLSSLPPVFEHPRFIVGLQSLVASKNQLKTLPDDLFNCDSLEKLNLDNNQFRELSDLFFQLSLKTLSMKTNRLREFPPIIESLHSLEWLALDSNQIGALPTSLEGLENLKILSLTDNPLIILPKHIPDLRSQLGSLQKLLH